MLYEDDVDFKFFKKLYFFAKFISGPGIECWCFNRLCILKCVLNGWLYSLTGIVNSCISEVAKKPLKETDFPSISPVTGELVSATMSIALFRWSQNLYISCLFYYSFINDNAKPTSLNCVNSNICSFILPYLKLHGIMCFMN